MKYLCGRCIHIDVCLVPKSTGCVEECKYFKEMPSHLPKQTNEEWFNGLATEEKAKRIINIAVNSDCDYKTIVKWLKQPHTNE